MKLRVVWSLDEKPHPKFASILKNFSSKIATASPLITSQCVKIPSYLYNKIFHEFKNYKGGVVKFITSEELKQIENEFIKEWNEEWISIKFVLAPIFPYPTCKILSKRKLEKEIIQFFREKVNNNFRALFYKISDVNKELNTDLDPPLDIPAIKQLNTLLKYKWKEK